MTIRAVAGPAAGRGPRPALRAFSVLDELNCYFDSPAEPNNVQLEAWLPGHLSPHALRTAVAAVLAAVPAAGARRAPGAGRASYAWEFPPAADVDPVSVTEWRNEGELDAARARFLDSAPELDHSPPFRLLLARGPGGDSLILNAHHAAFDGRSCVRLLRLIADRYGGEPPAEPEASARAEPSAGAADWGGGPRPGRRARPRRVPRTTARIAPQHTAGRPARGASGYGLSLLEWPGVPAAPLSAGGCRATVNDLLIAALIETIARWNSARRRPAGRIRISMPVDTRPPGNADELGNLSRLCTVTVEPGTGDPVAAVAGQTRRAKSEPGPLIGPVQAATARTRLPVPVKRTLVRLALRSVGWLHCDTSLLSNLGNVTDPPRFGLLVPTRMWFSPSAHMPRGLSVGAISVSGRLQVCFRYRRALLDDAAGRAFAAEYAASLSALAGGERTFGRAGR
jgi:NRPS condensation-like uncharacterized protein